MSFFPEIPKIQYEGSKSKNPFSFKQYNADEIVAGKTMKEHCRFAAAYWHVMRNGLSDPFGGPTALMPWDDQSDSVDNALKRADVFFEFMDKMGIDYYCWHDRDIAPELGDLAKSNAALEKVTDHLLGLQQSTGKKLLWGTACLFSHPRYSQGAGTSPNADVFAYGAAQVKAAMDGTLKLGGEGYTFWGGREGYSTLLNTDMKRELDNLANLLHLAVDYAKEIGFKGQFYIEPKPREPSTHQYDSDSAACLNFLRQYGLMDHFKLNLETNHATLAGHTMLHEMTVAIDANALGSVDANQGDELIGWDTDQFPTDIYLTTEIMLKVLEMGGFTTGGLNFDAKRRRESHEPSDLFHAHIGGMDAFARGLKIAAAIREDGRLQDFVDNRYASWNTGIGAKIASKSISLSEVSKYALSNGEPTLDSGRQEMLENLVNEFI
ncbi:MAG: xylose isomerase [Akkermansiaceae bacterium]|jgi:xylose isomerase|nr:xylose isomerase [Akkermansiaceae bacterium]MDP4647659.1 xylose isomerase [Akkermansiaceae bacterium]MDP4722282.1 xylose isomerase [Akkermansiaceae bacterium]MDP4780322.1 xylose isomerase [Akkermansiaceae bacterium]MDP4846194.1 xylose isomerase [Akkermansiaceae bacterium]